MATPSIKRKLAIDALATAVLQLVTKVRGIILLPILLRAGGEDLYGVWTMLGGAVALLIPLVNFSAHQGLLRFAAPLAGPEARRLFQRVNLLSLVSATGLTLCVAVVALVFSGGYPAAVTREVVAFTALQVPLFVAVRVNSAYLRARGRVVGAQFSELGAQFVTTLAACTLFLAGFGLAEVQASTAGLLLLEVLVVLALIYRSTESMREVSGARVPTLAMVASFSLPFVPGAVSDWALFISDRYIIAIHHGEKVVGIYAGCYAIAQALQMVSYPIEYSITPVLPRLWDDDEREKAAELLRSCVHLTLAVLAPTSTVLVIIGPTVLRALGSQAMAAQASTLLPVLAWGITIFACTRMMSLLALVAHRGRSVMLRVGVTAVVNVLANLALVPSMGALGSAIATLGSYALYAILIVRLSGTIAPELGRMGRPLRICAAALLPAAIILVPMHSHWLRLVASAGYLIAYCLLAVALRAVTREDLRTMQRVLRRSA